MRSEVLIAGALCLFLSPCVEAAAPVERASPCYPQGPSHFPLPDHGAKACHACAITRGDDEEGSESG